MTRAAREVGVAEGDRRSSTQEVRDALGNVDTVFLDLDGCVWFGATLADGAAELVRDLRAGGRVVAFLSNTSNSRASTVAEKLRGLGIEAETADVLMPIETLAEHPRMRHRPPTWVLGTRQVHEGVAELTRVVTDPEAAELVVLSRDPDLRYHDLADALQPLLRGASLLALNLDARVPVDGGRFVPGTGAIAAALEVASGVRADLVGKPSRFYFETALRRYGASPERSLMVGDLLDVDIAGGLGVGMWTVHVGGDTRSANDPAPVAHASVARLAEVRELLGL